MTEQERFRTRKMAIELMLIGSAIGSKDGWKRVTTGAKLQCFTTSTQEAISAIIGGDRDKFIDWLSWKLEITVGEDEQVLDVLINWLNDSVRNQWAHDFMTGAIERIQLGTPASKIQDELRTLIDTIGGLE